MNFYKNRDIYWSEQARPNKRSSSLKHAKMLFPIIASAVAPLALAELPSDTVQELPTIVVTATRVPRNAFDVPMAINIVDNTAITEDKLQVNLSEAINRVPGIVVQNRQNFAQDEQL